MRTSHSQEQGSRDSLWNRIDRACGGMNAFLIALAIGLLVLDMTCFTAVQISQLQAFRMEAGAPAQAPR